MTLTVTQNITELNLTVGYNGAEITINPVVNAVGGSARYVVIDGFEVLGVGKTTLTAFEVGDKFHGWIADRFVRGQIMALPVTLPDDVDDAAKVKLVQDSNLI